MNINFLNNFLESQYIDTGISAVIYDFNSGNTSGFFVKNLIYSGIEQYGQSGGNKYILQDYYPGFFTSCNNKNYRDTGMAYFEGNDVLKISKDISSDSFSLIMDIKSYGCNPDYIDINAQNLNEPSGINWNNINFIRTGYISGIQFVNKDLKINFIQINEQIKITGNDAGANDFFGISVSLNSAGNVALVGALREDPNGVNDAGSAYIFTGSGSSWAQAAKITGNDAGANDFFGISVSLNSAGNVALVGAYQEDPNGVNSAGSAYIFTGSGSSWAQAAKITGNDAAAFNTFGISVSLNSAGNVALVGNHYNSPNGISFGGAAYIFTGSGSSWGQAAKITGKDAGIGDGFGYSVSLNSAGNVALVGAVDKNTNGVNGAGSAYIFTGSGSSWGQAAKITGNDAGIGDGFGFSVSLNSAGNVALVGALREDPNGVNDAGSAYIFTGSGSSWAQAAKITGNDAGAIDNFGFSVSLNSAGNVALVGAYQEDPNGVNSAGSAYIFTGSGSSWAQAAKITGKDAGIGDDFGFSVSLNSAGNVALVGALREDPNGVNDAGSAYIFTGSGSSWAQAAKITGNDAGAIDNFGFSVSLNSAGNVALVGAYQEDPNGVNSAGSAYIFDIYNEKLLYTGVTGQISGFSEGGILRYEDNIINIIDNTSYTGYLTSIIATGITSGNYNFTLTGSAPIIYEKTFTGTFNIITGYVYEDESGNLIPTGNINFRSGNYIIGGKYTSGVNLPSQTNQINIYIEKNNLYDNLALSGNLFLTGSNLQNNIISGLRVPVFWTGLN